MCLSLVPEQQGMNQLLAPPCCRVSYVVHSNKIKHEHDQNKQGVHL